MEKITSDNIDVSSLSQPSTSSNSPGSNNSPHKINLVTRDKSAVLTHPAETSKTIKEPAPLMSQEAFIEGMKAGHVWTRRLPDGRELQLRKGLPDDTLMVSRFMNSLSDDSKSKRFGCYTVAPAVIENLTKNEKTTTLIAAVDGKIVGLTDITPHETPLHSCSIGLLVHQDKQNQGIGTALKKEAFGLAKMFRYTQLIELVGKSNTHMVEWLSKDPGFISKRPCPGEEWTYWEFTVSLDKAVKLEQMRVGDMREYQRPPGEAGTEVERLTSL